MMFRFWDHLRLILLVDIVALDTATTRRAAVAIVGRRRRRRRLWTFR